MKARFFLISFLVLPVFAHANGYLPPGVTPAIQRIIHNTIMQRYDSALAACDSLEKKYPQHPVGYFFHAATLQSRMMDYEAYNELDKFFELTQKAINLAKDDSKTYPGSSWPHFFLGGAAGYEAMVRGRHNELFRAFKDGLQSIRSLQTALEIDSTNYDIYLGIGTYKYYRSQVSKYLKWLPFIADERETGKKMIRLAIEKGRFSRAAAINGLFWILVKEENYQEAEELINLAVDENPGSRFFLWGKAKVHLKQEQWSQAIDAYKEILATYKAENVTSNYNEMQCYTSLGEAYFHLADYEQARSFSQMAIDMSIDDYLKDRAKPIKERAKNLLKEIPSSQ